MKNYYSIQLQLSEINNAGDYTVTVSSLFPNKSFAAGKIELASDDKKLLGNTSDIEIFCHVTARESLGKQDMHDFCLVWDDPKMNLGQEWKRVFCHLMLDGKVLLASMVHDSAKTGIDQSLIEGKKQKLSEISSVVSELGRLGMDASVMIHKEKGNGC